MRPVFDLDFDAPAAPPAAAPPDAPPPDEAARREGYAAGAAAARDEGARDGAAALAAVARALEALQADRAAHRAALEDQALAFARAACERLAPELVERLSDVRAAAEIRRCFERLTAGTALRVALSPRTAERHGADLAAAAEAAGLRLEIAADPALRDGDAAATWADGSLRYSFADAVADLAAALRAPSPITTEETEGG